MTAARIWPVVLAVLATTPAAWSQDRPHCRRRRMRRRRSRRRKRKRKRKRRKRPGSRSTTRSRSPTAPRTCWAWRLRLRRRSLPGPGGLQPVQRDGERHRLLLRVAPPGRAGAGGGRPLPSRGEALGPAGGAVEVLRGCLKRGPKGGSSVKAKPMTGQAKPMTGEAKPMTGEAKPMTGEAKPMTGKARPMTGKAKPTPLPGRFPGRAHSTASPARDG